MAVWAGAGAATAGLDSEEVIEDGNDKVVMQVPPRWPLHHEGHNREPLGLKVSENRDGWVGAPCCDGPTHEICLVGTDHVDADV